MTDSKPDTIGIDRSHSRSLPQKITFILGHLAVVLICSWLVLFNGWGTLGRFMGKEWALADPTRGKILLACTILYWFRHLITLFYLLRRNMGWSEAGGLLIFMAIFEIGFLLIGSGAFREYAINLGGLDLFAAVLLLGGSYLNSFSEIQRKWWKEKPRNKGHCYTEGLFRYSMHINYFGDTVLFTGWSLLTHNFWTLLLPLFIALSFVLSYPRLGFLSS